MKSENELLQELLEEMYNNAYFNLLATNERLAAAWLSCFTWISWGEQFAKEVSTDDLLLMFEEWPESEDFQVALYNRFNAGQLTDEQASKYIVLSSLRNLK